MLNSGYASGTGGVVRLGSVKSNDVQRLSTGMAELDRVLGGGLVPGGVVMIAGDSGIGKSTLSLQIAGLFSEKGHTTLYISGEENAAQIKMRADRLGVESSNVLLLCESSLEVILDIIETERPSLVVLDSMQTTTTELSRSAAGSPTQLRTVVRKLTKMAKDLNIPMVLVGHVTQTGSTAGPKELQHIVDSVLTFHGRDGLVFRELRPVKNRFGTVEEIGLFEMKADGLHALVDAGQFFLQGRDISAPGSAIVPTVASNRITMAEIQTSLTPATGKNKKTITGLDTKRVEHILSICRNMLGFDLDMFDFSINVVGHFEIKDPAADVGILLSIASAYFGIPIPDVAAFGELGLTGEVRLVPMGDQRALESRRLGLERIVTARGIRVVSSEVIVVENVFDVIGSVF